ncbi:MAG: long-chain fatty acid--CoA ligase, partial [Gemmatimonadota bacterium]|nr:long-chain fatty acid--CoA ligase [Gemmatimonadota bacterium]
MTLYVRPPNPEIVPGVHRSSERIDRTSPAGRQPREDPPLTVADLFRAQADTTPDAPFLWFRDAGWTYGQVATQSRALAVGLRNLGVEPGDRVAIVLPNWPEFVVAVLAAAELGARIVPLNPGYSPRELQYMLRHSEATVAITAEEHGGVDYLQLFET